MTDPSAAPDLRLIVLTDGALAAPRELEEVVIAALESGAPAIQLRDKAAMPVDLYRKAVRYRELTRRHGALLFINDRLDVALAAGADGVHLGPDDLPVAAARSAVTAAAHGTRSARFLIGFSADDPVTARAAEGAGADYIGCGAVFGTTSKPEAGDERIGTARLAQVARSVTIPVVGIGGITTENVDQIAQAGADGAAVIGAVMAAPDPAAAVRRLLAPFTPLG